MNRKLINYLGILGVVSFLSYVVTITFSPLAYPGYNWMSQAVSNLFAVNSPSLNLWNQLSVLYSACGMVSVTLVSVFIENKLNRTIRTGIHLFTIMNWISCIGYGLFPLSGNKTEALLYFPFCHKGPVFTKEQEIDRHHHTYSYKQKFVNR